MAASSSRQGMTAEITTGRSPVDRAASLSCVTVAHRLQRRPQLAQAADGLSDSRALRNSR